jgi:hypothetical protein
MLESLNTLIPVHHVHERFYHFLSRAFAKEADKAFLGSISEILKSLEDLSNFIAAYQEEDVHRGKHLSLLDHGINLCEVISCYGFQSFLRL